MKTAIVVSQESAVFQAISSCLAGDCEVIRVPDNAEALAILRERPCDFLLIDLDILRGAKQQGNSKIALQRFFRLRPTLEIIIMTHPDKLRETVMAVKAGASNYLTYPINAEEVRYVTESATELTLMQSELEHLRQESWEADLLDIAPTNNSLMEVVFDKTRSVAPTKSTVLLTGETGTGKGVLAKLIHRRSNRRNESFIHVHCGAIPDTLVESELFGHEKGAFTGAVRRKLGKFEIAKGGTIFLDEIGTITPSAQIKLLQILQDGVFQRVGGEETIQADVRIIAASNVDLRQMCDEGLFRRDLYYRLNVFPIEIPALRERREDIPVLVDTFMEKLNRFHEKAVEAVDPVVMEAFTNYSWPGNIRELENLMERAYILEPTSVLTPGSFPSEIFPFETPADLADVYADQTLTEARRMAVDQIEVAYLKKKLTENKGRIGDTAVSAGITTRQLHKLMKKHDIKKEEYKPSPNISSPKSID
jgi:DNA-binding NtrC family response regulator